MMAGGTRRRMMIVTTRGDRAPPRNARPCLARRTARTAGLTNVEPDVMTVERLINSLEMVSKQKDGQLLFK